MTAPEPVPTTTALAMALKTFLHFKHTTLAILLEKAGSKGKQRRRRRRSEEERRRGRKGKKKKTKRKNKSRRAGNESNSCITSNAPSSKLHNIKKGQQVLLAPHQTHTHGVKGTVLHSHPQPTP